MSEYKCPVCEKELSEEEVNDNMCLECGCYFVITDKENKKLKRYSSIIKDNRKTNYIFWIRFHIFFLFVWAALTVYAIVQSFFSLSSPWNIVVTIGAILLYIVVFVLVQFHINLIRDVYVLRLKIKELEKDKK